MRHTPASAEFRSQRIDGHQMQVHASARTLWLIYERHPRPIVDRHIARVIRALAKQQRSDGNG